MDKEIKGVLGKNNTISKMTVGGKDVNAFFVCVDANERVTMGVVGSSHAVKQVLTTAFLNNPIFDDIRRLIRFQKGY